MSGHSHDTSTPAMSAETVPSEEFVLVPKRALDWLDGRGPDLEGTWFGELSANAAPYWWRRHFSEMIAAAPTLSASHLAKEGGEAGAVEQSVSDGMLAILIRENVDGRRPNTAAALRELAARRTLPQPSPALAKGGDAVQEALKPFLSMTVWEHIDDDACLTKPAEHGVRISARYIRQLAAALSTPTEGPASQTEGMGGDAGKIMYVCAGCEDSNPENCGRTDRHDLGVAPDGRWLCEDCWSDAGLPDNAPCPPEYRPAAALTPPETAEAVPVAASGELPDISLRGMIKNINSDHDLEVARLREEMERESEESYEIGKRDGYEEAVQYIDQRTGGDGEYCCVVGYDADDRHCPDPQSMIARIVGHFESLAGQTNAANHERDDAVKAFETAREDLGLFRDFVINNATVWASGSNHHHPIWERIARHLDAYQSPTSGDLWKLVCSDDLAARSASSQGGE